MTNAASFLGVINFSFHEMKTLLSDTTIGQAMSDRATFTLFYEDSDEQLARLRQKREAVAMAKRLSQETGRSVYILFAPRPGQTALCCKFERGENVHDSHCCPDDYGSSGS